MFDAVYSPYSQSTMERARPIMAIRAVSRSYSFQELNYSSYFCSYFSLKPAISFSLFNIEIAITFFDILWLGFGGTVRCDLLPNWKNDDEIRAFIGELSDLSFRIKVSSFYCFLCWSASWMNYLTWNMSGLLPSVSSSMLPSLWIEFWIWIIITLNAVYLR